MRVRWSAGTAGTGRLVGVSLTSLALAVLAGCGGSDAAPAAETQGGSSAHGHSHDSGGPHSHGHAAPDAQDTAAPNRRAPAGSIVIQPGRPGEEATTLSPDATLPADEHNAADAAFLQQMIPHHAQALEMGDLARTRAQDREVRSLALRIHDAQGPEIVGMSGWLERQGLEAPTAEDLERHGRHMSMPGMLSEAQMQRLRAARGAEFDELFLRYMTQHHRGAVQMSHHVMQQGRNVVVGELAADIAATQTAEIDRMQQLLRSLS
jgi:uncharacterized protein (DUF305 family)